MCNLLDSLPTMKKEDLVDNLAALPTPCNAPSSERKFVGGFDPRVIGDRSTAAVTDPFQSDIPITDPFHCAMHPQRGHDLEKMHDFLREQCSLPPLLDQQQPNDNLSSQTCTSTYVTALPILNPGITSNDTVVSSRSLFPAKASLYDSDIAGSCPFPEPSIIFPMTPPHQTKYTALGNLHLKGEPPIASNPPRDQCSTQPRPECSGPGTQILRPRRRSTGETSVSISIHQPTRSEIPNEQSPTSGLSHGEIHVKNRSISVYLELSNRLARSSPPSTPPPSRFPSNNLMVTPDRSRASSISSRTSRSGGSVTCGEPTRKGTSCRNSVRVSDAYLDGLRADDSFEGICWRHKPSSRGTSASPSPNRNTQNSRTASSDSGSPRAEQVKIACDGSSQNLTSETWYSFPSDNLMVTPDRSRASSTSSSTSRSGGSVTCGEPTQKGTPCRNSVRVSDAYLNGLRAGDSFEGICWRHKPLSPNRNTQNSRTTSSDSGSPRAKQCKRAAIPVLAIYYRQEQDKQDENGEQDVSIKQFCRIHRGILLTNQGVFLNSVPFSDPVRFDEYIPCYLHPATRAALCRMMEAPLSESDRPGYIYGYHLQENDGRTHEETVFIKVGRTVDLPKRINDWAKQCPSKIQVLKDYWPFQTEESADGSTDSLLKGCLMPRDMGPLHHRVERLVHIELADLVMNQQYLRSGFPNLEVATESSFDVSCPNSPAGRQLLQSVKCSDCSQVHREIFPFARIRSGDNMNKEWESIVVPVIERWGKYAKYVADHIVSL